MRVAPVSPVRLSFHPDNWAQPSNASIEGSQMHPTQSASIEESAEEDISDSNMNGSGNGKLLDSAMLQASSDKSSKEGTTKLSAQASANAGDSSTNGEGVRRSRDTDTSSSTQQMASIESSVATNASSVSQDAGDSQLLSEETSPEESVIDDSASIQQSVPQLQYHHHQSMALPRVASAPLDVDPRPSSTINLGEQGMAINRHLTPTSAAFQRRSSMPRPQSSYSVYSDLSPRGRSPGLARKSPDARPASYAELLNVPYPQPAPAPITIDNSQLRTNVGSNASLLSTQKTLEITRLPFFLSPQPKNKVFTLGNLRKGKVSKGEGAPPNEEGQPSPAELVREAKSILTRLANGGYPFAQYYLADGYASGLFNKGKEDYNAAFPLFILAAKHGHAESAYRAGLCYEFGWGCRKDPAKAIQYLRTAASKTHPGAMTRLGKACLAGDFGETRYREGIKWLKRATESSDTIYNAAPYQLGTLYEKGYGEDVFKDESYAAELFTQAAELGHAEASFRMGDAYEHGKLNCPRDPALSVHFYTGAAEGGHAGAMMGLCAWYLVGAEPILEKDEEEAYEWARRSAELGFVKAQYTVGYFTEMGIGCRRDILEANVWYVKAADAGDERATLRLAAIRAAVSGGGVPMEVAPPKSAKMRKNPPKEGKDGKDDKDCVVM
ncbi:chitin synthase activator [Apiospora arundinis]